MSYKVFLLMILTINLSARQCSWIKSLDKHYASHQFKNSLDGQSIKVHLNNSTKKYKRCVELWLDKSQIVEHKQMQDLWIKMSPNQSHLIIQTNKDGIQIKLPQKHLYHYLALLLCTVLLVINNRATKRVTFTQIIDSVNDLIHLLHNQQNQDLVLTSQNIKKLKLLNSWLNSNVNTKFYFKVDQQKVRFQTLKSEVCTIVKESLANKIVESCTRKVYLKTLSKYSSYCYLNLASLLDSNKYKLDGDVVQCELSFFYTSNTNWDYHQQQLQKILNDWMDITADNVTNYSQNHPVNFDISNSPYPMISISNPAKLNPEKAQLIKQHDVQQLSKIKKRSTGYPKLISDIKKYNDTLKRSRQSISLKLALKQEKDMVIATLSFQTTITPTKGMNILIIDDDAQSKYFQHSQIADCLAHHNITIKSSFVDCKDLQDQYDLVLMDRNFPIEDLDGDFVSQKEMQFLCSKFDPSKTYLVSTDSSDCKELFKDGHILSIRNLIPTIDKVHKKLGGDLK